MKRFLLGVVSLWLLCAAIGCGKGPDVLQGRVVRYDPATQDLVVKDERGGQREVRLSLKDAEIGAEPQADDLVRIAYLEVRGRLVASRVMNLTRQEEIAAHAQ
jgi:hypothetical protein